ncbi:hypothetical protein SEPCBS57363_001457 [Sporothrix epigloea]|uniref:Uncharacterized protein n=1 Tax=Sporothrix epigloea TaxID=1892477 RepID=A0ABP0DC26_9PEZI
MLSSVRELWATDMGRPDHRERSRTAAVAAASAVVAGELSQKEGRTVPVHPGATAAMPPMLLPLENGSMALNAPFSTDGVALPFSSIKGTEAVPPAADAMTSVTDSTMLSFNDELFSVSSAMDIPEDYLFWDLFLNELPQIAADDERR